MRKTVILGAAVVAAFGAGTIGFACGSSTSDPTVTPGPGPQAPIDNTPGSSSSSSSSSSGGVTETLTPCPDGQGIPQDQIFTATGTCAYVAARNLGAMRQLQFAPNGDLFGVTSNGQIKRFVDANKDGVWDDEEITNYASTSGNGNNLHIDGGFLYAGSPGGVKRFTYADGAANGGAGQDVVVNQPTGGHATHTVHVYDGYLYVDSGSAENMRSTNADLATYDTQRSLIRRFKLSDFNGTAFDWMSGEIVTQGLRNPNGFTRNAAGKIFAVVNGMDNVSVDQNDVHADNPGEQIVEIGMGKSYGYPFCFTAQNVKRGGNLVTAGTQLANEQAKPTGNPQPYHDDAWCATNSLQPATFIQAHSAPLDIVFFDSQPKGKLPERFRGGAFVALHGSWNREIKQTGYKVVWVPFDANGKAPMPVPNADGTTKFPYETVFGGGKRDSAEDGVWSWESADGKESPRPAGVAISPIDGALYIASDAGGYIYRLAKPN